MGNIRRAGFTIIETMLFLGVSGLLVLLLVGGTAASINTQRYQDATETLKSLLQQQYSDISSVQNSRDNNWSCDATATPTTTGTTKENRGQSDCILLGKYVRLEDDKISVYKVVAYQKATATESDDIESLKSNYTLNVSAADVEKSTMEWGTKISYPSKYGGVAFGRPLNPRSIGILIVRSPDSGLVYTFTNSDGDVPADGSITSDSLDSMLVASSGTPGQGERTVCINSGGLLATNDQAVHLDSYASNTGAVQLLSNAMLAANGSGIEC